MSLEKIEDASIEAYCVIEDDLWFVPRNINMLCKLNLKTGKTERVLFFEHERKLEIHLFVKIFFDGSNLWFVPNNAEHVYSFNIYNNKLEEYSLPAVLKGISNKCSAAYYDGKDIWIFPLKYSIGLRINVKERKIMELHNLYPQNHKSKLVYTQIVKQENNIYGICFEKLLIKYNCITKQLEYIELPSVKGGYYAITLYKNKIYVFGAEAGSVTICDINLQILDVKMLVEKRINCEALDCIVEQDVMIISYCPDILVRWELTNNKVMVCQYKKLEKIKESEMLGEGGIGRFVKYNSNILLTPVDYCGIRKINKELEIVGAMPVKLRITSDILWGEDICIYEGSNYIDRREGKLETFLEYLEYHL